MSNTRFAPEFQLKIGGEPVLAALRASVTSVSFQTSFDAADRVEISLTNENLRWLDHRLLALDQPLSLSLGYAPDPLTQVFAGQIVGTQAGFPSGGAPTLTVIAQDRRHRMQGGGKVRWFAVPIPTQGNFPIPDLVVAGALALENRLVPEFEPVAAAIATLVGGIEMYAAYGSPEAMQKIIRKQAGESDYDLLKRIARENDWDMVMDHSEPLGGMKLRFLSSADQLDADLSLRYGLSLVDFTPRISNVGQIAAVEVNIWRPEIKTEFRVRLAWDWDRQDLVLTVSPGFGMQAGGDSSPDMAGQAGSEEDSPSWQRNFVLVDEPVSPASAARELISRLIPSLNERLTGSGSTIGDVRILPGAVIQLEGVGRQFGGRYRVTSATHTLDNSGYRTSFEVRKEIWFGSIPAADQAAVEITGLGVRIG